MVETVLSTTCIYIIISRVYYNPIYPRYHCRIIKLSPCFEWSSMIEHSYSPKGDAFEEVFYVRQQKIKGREDGSKDPKSETTLEPSWFLCKSATTGNQ